jgi:hypothetical protein
MKRLQGHTMRSTLRLFKYASKGWSITMDVALLGRPSELSGPTGMVYLGCRCDGPKVVGIDLATARSLLIKHNAGRGYDVAKLTRTNLDMEPNRLSVVAWDRKGKPLAIIGHDGKNFDIVG